MAAAFVGGAAFGEGFAALHDTVKDVVSKTRTIKPFLKHLESTLDRLAPTVNEITQSSEQLDLPEVETKSLIELMEEGKKLVHMCLKLYYSPKLKELGEEIVRFCQIDMQARNGPRNLFLQRGVPCTVRDPPDSTVRLDKRMKFKMTTLERMKELKTLLLKEEVQLLLLIAPVGCGSISLIKMLCQDDQIRGIFMVNILCMEVIVDDNVFRMMNCQLNYEDMRPNFQIQRDEDLIDKLSQLLNHLSPNPILLILDVKCLVQSLPEKFKFDLPNIKILVRSHFALPGVEFTYDLSPPNDVDAMTLFHSSASLHDENSYIPALRYFSSDTSLHSPLGAAMPSPSASTSQPIAKSKSAPMNGQWHKGKYIGRGAFGCVYVATNMNTGALCAMKEVALIPDDPRSAECVRQLQQEIRFLRQLKHPNIVQYYGTEIVNNRFYVCLEYVYPGSINNYVCEHYEAITESVVRNFTRHILSGLAYLHSTKTMHRDIKGANLLVTSSGLVKLADFGLAKHLALQEAKHSSKGTAHWMAPELVQSLEPSSPDVALAVDIWSVGCTIIEMLTGKHPWGDLEVVAVIYRLGKGMTPPIPETLSPVGKEFLSLCLKINPAERPSAASLLEHPFVKNSEQLDGN